MESLQVKTGKRFKIGIGLILVSIIIGWPVLPLFGTIALVHGRIWMILGVIIYTLSWILLGAGALMAGPDGVRYAKELIRKIFKKTNEKT